MAVVGLDAIEGMDLPSLSSNPVRHFLKLVEETLEMLGNTVFLLTFSSVLHHHTTESFHRLDMSRAQEALNIKIARRFYFFKQNLAFRSEDLTFYKEMNFLCECVTLSA